MASEAPKQPAPDSAVAAVVAPPERADEIFLEGPSSRFAEFWTLLRVMRDFMRGFRTLHFVGPCVTVFGSARIKSDDLHYELARKMGRGDCTARLHGNDRRRPRHYGGGQSRRKRGRRPLGRMQHRAAIRAGIQHVSRIVVSGCIIFSFARRCW